MKNTKSNTIIFLLIILTSSSLLIAINFFTIKTLSATRAYVNGESHYSKGQNVATRNLTNYLFTGDKKYYIKFEKYLSIPMGDAKARIALIACKDRKIIKEGFREGMNSEEDLDDMIWLFQNFKDLSFLKAAILEWEGGDNLVQELYEIGATLKIKIENGKLEYTDKIKILSQLDKINNAIAIKQNNFSDLLGEGTRALKYYLLLTNILFICIIMTSVSYYYSSVLKKVIISRFELNLQKKQLKAFIKDLQLTKENLSTQIIQHKKIIGTISHDISSPLNYIQIIAKRLSENINEKLDSTSFKYVNSIYKSSTQLCAFTKNLIEYSNIYIEEKNYKEIVPYSVYLLIESKKNIYDEIAKSNNTLIINESNENLNSQINVKILSIVLQNLLDNAVKFTKNGLIRIGAKVENKKLIFWVCDNGIGMNQDLLEYYSNLSLRQDSEKLILSNYGIGLHLVHELLNIVKGKIKFNSASDEGTTITIEIDIIEND